MLIQIEYRIAPENQAAFLQRDPQRRADAPAQRRGRAGACSATSSEEGRFVERFVIDSFAEYVRLRTRMTQTDRRLQESAEQFQQPDVPIRTSRYIGVGRDEPPTASGPPAHG